MKKRRYLSKEKFTPYALILPGMLLLVIIIFIPFIQNVYYSFTDYSLLTPKGSFIGIDNYIEIFRNSEFVSALGNSIIWVLLNLVLVLLIGIVAALILNSKHLKGTIVFQALLLIPWVLPEVVTGYTWKLLLLYQTGPYYRFLEFFKLIGAGDDIFANPQTAMIAVVIANVWRSFPIVAITVYAKLQSLSVDQIEAATMDGANRMQILRSIELPHIKSTIISVGTLCFIWTFNAFGIIHIMTGGGPAGGTETLPLLLQQEAFQFYDYSKASTYAVIMIVILIVIVLGTNLAMRKKSISDK